MTSKPFARLGRFSINAQRIGASPAAVVELLRQHWISAACFSAAWLLAIQAQTRVPVPQDAPGSPCARAAAVVQDTDRPSSFC